MNHLIVQVRPVGDPTLLHLLHTETVARSIFTEEECRMRPDEGLYLFKVHPLSYPTRLDRETAEALAKVYGACLRARALRTLESAFGRRYALMEGLKESA